MFERNHTLLFRPLVGGISIHNPVVRSLGTLGCILTSNGQDRWILSAYHVLGREDRSAYEPGEEIFQPSNRKAETPVARMVEGRSDAELDIAAAEVVEGVETRSEILGLGALHAVREPVVGMRVVKSGVATGVTEGRVSSLMEGRIEIELEERFPPEYELSFRSDSGAVWVDRETRAAVGLHYGGEGSGREMAFAVPFPTVLEVLDLRLPEAG